MTDIRVRKRNGDFQPVDFEKIHWRIKGVLANPKILEYQKKDRIDSYEMYKNLNEIKHANVDQISLKTIEGLYNGIPTKEIDVLSSEIAQSMSIIHPDNGVLASRLYASNLQKNTKETLIKRFPQVDKKDIETHLFRYTMESLYFNRNKKGEVSPLVSPYILALSIKYPLDDLIDHSRDYTNHDYLGLKMLENTYLFKCYELDGIKENYVMVERPQIADMRMSLAINCTPIHNTEKFPIKTVLEVISLYPSVIKGKYSVKDTIPILSRMKEPHKSKYINVKEFYKYYWNYVFERVLETVHLDDFEISRIKQTYDAISTGKYTPATPARFNLGTLQPQVSSCFLLAMKDDSLNGIYETLAKQAQISKYAGGIGVWVHNIRSAGSYISGTNGISNGLVPMLKVFNSSSKYVDQGGGKRPGAVAIYIEPWHPDILRVIALKRKQGLNDRARALFYAMWIPDEFFRCLKNGKPWYLFDPAICPKLYKSYDETFSKDYLTDEYIKEHKEEFLFTYRYRKYIKQGKYEKFISPNVIIEELVKTVKESGIPYMLAKDACNRKSNQKNLGTICSSNLCTEIIQYSDENETSVCNLSSICLNKFTRPFIQGDDERFKYNVNIVNPEESPEYWTFDWDNFRKIVKIVHYNLDKTIDINFYPTKCGENSNLKNRPLGIGVQGEADLMASLRLPWHSKEANKLRFYIFETLYYECLSSSNKIAKIHGSYSSFNGSPSSNGLLQFDLWEKEGRIMPYNLSCDWGKLKENVQKSGLRNSLFIAPMPTASTSNIMGNSPCFEPFNSLIYNRKVGIGEVTLVNKSLVKDLMELNMWDKDMSNTILEHHGSIQDILKIPKNIRDIYVTAFDLDSKHIIDAAYHRAWFVDQSQSLNLYMNNVTMKNLTSAWTRGWRKGLKTLMYYCRTKPSINPQKNLTKKVSSEQVYGNVCDRNNPDCLSCGS